MCKNIDELTIMVNEVGIDKVANVFTTGLKIGKNFWKAYMPTKLSVGAFAGTAMAAPWVGGTAKDLVTGKTLKRSLSTEGFNPFKRKIRSMKYE